MEITGCSLPDPLLTPVQSQVNPFLPMPSCFFKMCFSIILPSMRTFSRYSLSLRLSQQNVYAFCSALCMLGTQPFSIAFCDEYEWWSSLLCNSALSRVIFFISEPHIMPFVLLTSLRAGESKICLNFRLGKIYLQNYPHPIQGILRLKWPGLGADHLPPPDSEINTVKLYLSSSICLHSLELNYKQA